MTVSGRLCSPAALLPILIVLNAEWALKLFWPVFEEKNILPLPGIELRLFGRPSSSLNTILTSVDQCDKNLVPLIRVLLQTLIVAHLLKKFYTFYRKRKFITGFTKAHHLSLFWASGISFTSTHAIYLRSILILPSHLRVDFSNGLSPLGFLK